MGNGHRLDAWHKWDQKSAILTLSDMDRPRLVGLIFSSQSRGPSINFTVLIRGTNAVVRSFSDFGRDDARRWYHVLQDLSQTNDPGDLVLETPNGTRLRILVSVDLFDVSHWRICEVYVDAMDIY